MQQYRTKDGDVLDEICKRHYGTEDRVQQVLDANDGLVLLDPVLAAGLLINLPEFSQADDAQQPVKLFS